MRRIVWAAIAAGGLGAAILTGCEIGSADKVYRQVGVSIAGVYVNPNAGGANAQ